jgi:hypothetical protein
MVLVLIIIATAFGGIAWLAASTVAELYGLGWGAAVVAALLAFLWFGWSLTRSVIGDDDHRRNDGGEAATVEPTDRSPLATLRRAEQRLKSIRSKRSPLR